METSPLSMDNLVSCFKCQENTKRLQQLAAELSEVQNELIQVRDELVNLINRFESMRETNNLWDGS